MKKIFTFLFLFTAAYSANAQTTLFNETFGTAIVTAEPLRPNWTAGGPALTNLNIVINTQDTPTIAGGSGMGNLINSRPTGGTPATIQGIATYTLGGGAVSTVGHKDIKVIWACRKTASDSTDVSLEWSADSVTWNALTFLPDTATHPARWVLANEGVPIALPVAAEGQPNLRFRFTFNRTGSAANAGNYRVDDFKVTGTPFATGISPVNESLNILGVSPNPASDLVYLNHPVASSKANINVYNSNGNLLLTVKPSAGSKQTSINIGSYHTGVYVVKYTDGKQNVSARIVKN